MRVEGQEATEHKRHAVEVHTQQAAEFEGRYQTFANDPYASTFTYGRKKIEELIDGELRHLPRGSRVLDIGCGTGFNVRQLAERGFEVSGVEPSGSMRENAQKENPGARIIDGDAESLPFPDASFDAVLMIEVIRYLADPARALAEAARVLRPGGLAIVTIAPLFSANGYALLNLVTSRVQLPTFTKVRHSFMTSASAYATALRAGFSSAAVHGRFLGPWQGLGRLAPQALRRVLLACEPLDDLLADRPILRELTNHLVLVARR
jgi:ubiquinone/menaquinone biosynthesis C-methylase UbiE